MLLSNIGKYNLLRMEPLNGDIWKKSSKWKDHALGSTTPNDLHWHDTVLVTKAIPNGFKDFQGMPSLSNPSPPPDVPQASPLERPYASSKKSPRS